VLRKALELLAWYDAEVEAKRDALRGIIREGIESGAPRDTDIDALGRRIERQVRLTLSHVPDRVGPLQKPIKADKSL
jgi:hypothetical protein